MSKDKIINEDAFNYVKDNYDETLKILAEDKMLIVEATKEELDAIKKGKEEIANREFFSYKNVDELRKDLEKDRLKGDLENGT